MPPNVMEIWEETSLLPSNQRDATIESALIDIIITNNDVSNINSLQDCKLFVKSFITKVFTITTAGVASGAVDRVARKLFLYINTNTVQANTELDKMLKSIQKSLTISTSLVEHYYKDDNSSLVLTFPDFEDEEDTLKVVVLLIALVTRLHGTKIDSVKITKDPKLGSGKMSISASMKKLVLDLQASAENPSGLYAGERFKFPSGFTGNLVDMVAAMRLLNLKQEFIRRRKFSKESGKAPVSFNTLQESFNVTAGLKGGSDQPFVSRFIKASLNSCIKAHNKSFPGGWIHSSRVNNSVKSDFALLNVLGWTEKVPSNHKMLEVLFNTVDPTNDPKKFKVINITADKRQFSHQEFRTAVALTLPRIDSSKPSDDDMKLDPLSVKSLKICDNFVQGKRDVLVDSLNESYALKVSLKNPKTKTREIHYKISRERTLGLSANLPLIDSKGKSYDSFKDLPSGTQTFLREKFRYPSKKRVHDDGDNMEVEVTDVPTPVERAGVGAQEKRKRLTKGQAKLAIRKSGRIAKLAKKGTT